MNTSNLLLPQLHLDTHMRLYTNSAAMNANPTNPPETALPSPAAPEDCAAAALAPLARAPVADALVWLERDGPLDEVDVTIADVALPDCEPEPETEPDENELALVVVTLADIEVELTEADADAPLGVMTDVTALMFAEPPPMVL